MNQYRPCIVNHVSWCMSYRCSIYRYGPTTLFSLHSTCVTIYLVVCWLELTLVSTDLTLLLSHSLQTMFLRLSSRKPLRLQENGTASMVAHSHYPKMFPRCFPRSSIQTSPRFVPLPLFYCTNLSYCVQKPAAFAFFFTNTHSNEMGTDKE